MVNSSLLFLVVYSRLLSIFYMSLKFDPLLCCVVWQKVPTFHQQFPLLFTRKYFKISENKNDGALVCFGYTFFTSNLLLKNFIDYAFFYCFLVKFTKVGGILSNFERKNRSKFKQQVACKKSAVLCPC